MIAKRTDIKKIFIVFLLGIFLTCSFALSWAGNKKMVEETVQEMDDLNKQAVQQVPDLPKDGRVDIKADVRYEKKKPVFDIYYKRTAEKDGEINFGNNEQKKPSQNEETIENDSKDN